MAPEAGWRPERARLGVVGRPHGLDGTVRIEGVVDWFAYRGGVTVLVGGVERRIVAARGGEHAPVHVRFDGVETREGAEALRGAVLEVPAERLPEPEEDAFWVFDLVGCRAASEGRELGVVREVLERPANDVLVVDGADGELLVPFTRDAVPEVDVTARRLEVAAWLLDAPLDDR